MDKASLSIFARPPLYFRRGTITHRYPHLLRTSSLVRGEQIAQHLGVKYNPTEGYANDVCVYVKPLTLDDIKDGSWVDILDGFGLLKMLKERPGIGIIFCSEYHYEMFKDKYPNRSVLIPHHHCNFERIQRTRTEIKTVGFIGNIRGLEVPVPEITEKLAKIGLEFITNNTFETHEDVINFYKQIDIQLIWKKDNAPYVTPLKVTNASSFGIPTVSKQCENFKELDGFYIPVTPDIDSLIYEMEQLKDQTYYDSWAKPALENAERYHIDNISQLYHQLTV